MLIPDKKPYIDKLWNKFLRGNIFLKNALSQIESSSQSKRTHIKVITLTISLTTLNLKVLYSGLSNNFNI